jgi:hypothetical protein
MYVYGQKLFIFAHSLRIAVSKTLTHKDFSKLAQPLVAFEASYRYIFSKN